MSTFLLVLETER